MIRYDKGTYDKGDYDKGTYDTGSNDKGDYDFEICCQFHWRLINLWQRKSGIYGDLMI